VLSTIHTLDAPESINRMLDFFPAPPAPAGALDARRDAARRDLAAARAARRRRRVAVCEVLRMTGRARDMILDPTRPARSGGHRRGRQYYGMQTFDQALYA
jgi:twitching motility protein PilT